MQTLEEDCRELHRTTQQLNFRHEDELAQITSLEKQLRSDRRRKTRSADYEALLDEQRAEIRKLGAELELVSREAEKQRMSATLLAAKLEQQTFGPPEPQPQTRIRLKQAKPPPLVIESQAEGSVINNPLPLPPEPLEQFPAFSPGQRDPNAPFPFFVPLSITPHGHRTPTAVGQPKLEHVSPLRQELSASPAIIQESQTPRPIQPTPTAQFAGGTPFFSPQPKLPPARYTPELSNHPEIDTLAKLKDAQSQLDRLLNPEAPPRSRSPSRARTEAPPPEVLGPSVSGTSEDRKHKRKHKHRRPRSDVLDTVFPIINEDNVPRPVPEPFAPVPVVGGVGGEAEKLKQKMETLDRKGKARQESAPTPIQAPQAGPSRQPVSTAYSVPSTPRNLQDAQDFLYGYQDGYGRGFTAGTSNPPRRGASTVAPRALAPSYSLPQYAFPSSRTAPDIRRPSTASSDDSLAGALGGIPVPFGGSDAPHRRTLSDVNDNSAHTPANSFLPFHPPPGSKRTEGAGSHRTVYQEISSSSDMDATPSKRHRPRRTKTATSTGNALGLEGFSEPEVPSGLQVIAPKPRAGNAQFLRSYSEN